MRKLSFLLMLIVVNIFMAQQIDQPVKELSQAEREQRIKSLHTTDPKEEKPEPFEILTRTTINPTTPTVATGTSNEVGITPGELSVSLTGGAVYNIPIYTPPGINGVEPKISLAYNSQAGNGMAGWGWNITGLSSITRVAATMHHDGRVGGVNLNMQDRFALDGQRLLLKDPSQTYGGLGTEYVTETYSNIRIIASSTAHPMGAQYGPASFTVYYPDGSVATYGTVANSQSHIEWSLGNYQDRRGLEILYTYTSADNINRITQIAYGHHTNDTPINFITFEYTTRTRRESSFVGGHQFINRFILNKIRIFGSNVCLRNYDLTYNTTSLNYQRLERITERNGDNTRSLNPTVFEYEHTTNDGMFNPTGEDILNVTGANGSNSSYISGDFYGTGIMQIGMYPTTGVDAYKWISFKDDISAIHFSNKFESIFSASLLDNSNKFLPQTCIGLIEKLPNDSNTTFKLLRKTHNGISQIDLTNRQFSFPRIEVFNDCPTLIHCDFTFEPDAELPLNEKNEKILKQLRTEIIIDPGTGNPIDPTDPIYHCILPNNLTVMGVYGDQATVHWYQQPNSPTQTFEVCYINTATGIPPSNTDPVPSYNLTNQNYFTAYGIDLTQTYSFYVRRICYTPQGIIHSDWVGPVSTSNITNTFIDIPKKYISGDFNGDGITDIIAIEQPTGYNQSQCNFANNCYTEEYIAYNGGNAFYINLDRRLPADNFVFPLDPIHYSYRVEVGDFNGNGKSNLFVFSNGNVKVYELNENNQLVLLSDFTHGHIKLNTQLLFGDYNGDGKTDVLIPQEHNQDSWTFFYSNGINFNVVHSGMIGLMYRNSYEATTTWEQEQGLSGRNNARVLYEYIYIPVDFNQDGKTDIYSIRNVTKKYEFRTNYYGYVTSQNWAVNGDPLEMKASYAINNNHNNTVTTFSIFGDPIPVYDLHYTTYDNLSNNPTGLRKHPIPIYTNHRNPYKQGELSLISHDRIRTYNSPKNNQIDTALRKITLGNGLEEGITYAPLLPGLPNSFPFTDPVYQAADLNLAYPYYNLAAALSFLVVSELQRKSMTANHYLKQRYRYKGVISRMDGLGFQGFQATSSTNWYHETDQKIFTNHKKYDATLRGALVEDLTFWGWWHPSPTLDVSSFVSKTVLQYQSNLSANKVYKLNNFRQTAYDGLSNTSKRTEYGRYDTFNNPREIYEGVFNNNVSEKTVMTYIAYENNPTSTSNYFIGRVRSKQSDKSKPSLPMLTEREEYDYNTVGLVSEIRKRGHNTPFITESNQFDTYGNITQKTITADGVSRVSSYEYDPSNRFVKKSTDVEGLFSQFTYYQPTGLLQTETTPYGLTITHEYDTWGKKTKTIDYLLNENTISYVWQNNRRTTRVTSALADGSLTVEDKDDLGRITDSYYKNLQGMPGETANTANVRLRQEYDYLNQLIRKSEPTTTPTFQWTNFEYDIYGRPTKVTLPSGRQMNTTYNGLTTTVVDTYTENGQTINNSTIVTKNALGLETTKSDNGGTLTFNYDANDNLTTTNYGTHQVSITYDGWGRKSALSDPSAGDYTYTYNGFGEVLTEATPNGTTTYNYAPTTGKLNSKTVVGGNSTILTNTTTSYQYYPAAHTNRGLIELITHLDSGESPSRTTTYFYDYDGHRRLNLTIETTPEARFEKQLFYDHLGRNHEELTSATHLGTGRTTSRRVRTTYQNGHFRSLQDVSNNNQNIYQINTINARNQVLTASLGNSLNVTNTYTALGFLTQARTTNTSGVQVINLTSTFNQQSGNLTARNSSLFTNVNETNIRYDNLDRLTHYRRYRSNGTESRPSQQDYMPDGRITINAAGTYNYAASNRYRQTNLQINTNDNPYPILNRQEQNVTYHVDKSPRTIQVNVPTQQNNFHSRLTFFNGIDGRSRVDFGTGRQKFYSADGSAEITRLPSGQVEIAIFLGGDAYSAPAVLHNNANNQNNLLYLHRDYLGSIVAVTNQAGTLTERRHFDAWGLLSHYSNAFGGTTLPDGVNTFLFLDRGYTGHEHLLSVGLVHMNGRLYDPILHRFLQPDNYVQDPSNTQNYNRYGYVYNNPFKFSDPSGEFVWLIYAAVNIAVDLAINRGNMNFGQIFMSGFQGALAGFTGGATTFGGALIGAGVSQLNRVMPSMNINLGGGFNFSISGAIAFGNSLGAGFNIGLSYTNGDWSFAASYGYMSYGNYNGFGANSEQVRWSLLASYDDGKRGFSLGTNFWRGDFKQRTGMLGFRFGDFKGMYENDGTPFNGWSGDGGDGYRTAALNLSVNDYSVGFNLFTGYRDLKGEKSLPGDYKGGKTEYCIDDFGRNLPNGAVIETGTKYRLGALTVGYKGYRFGVNSEKVRHAIQNHAIHNLRIPWFNGKSLVDKRQRGFENQSWNWKPYFQYATPNSFTSW